MTDGVEWRWLFLGYESIEEGRPVQVWFDALSEEAKDEIRDLLGYLEKMTTSLWRKPEFDPLSGAGGISELRPMDVSVDKDGQVDTATYRIYGFFGPKGYDNSYTFLHGTRKTVKNDNKGKHIARERLKRLQCGEATVHRFEFQR